nr:MAG: ORF1 [Torque teno polar bear virus 29]
MPYRHRRRRWRTRRVPRRRHFLRYRSRFWWRRFPRTRRRFRKQTVRQTRPNWVRRLVITGVEFLGVLGSEVEFIYNKDEGEDGNLEGTTGQWQINVKNIAPCNKEVKYWQNVFPLTDNVGNTCNDRFNQGTTPTYWDYVGGFGQAHFTLQTLIFRTIFGFARFSTLLEGVKYIKFNGFQMDPQRAPTLNYLFLADNHTQGKDYKTPLIHPVNLLNTPGTRIVNSIQRSKCCRGPRIRRRADPGLYAWTDLEDFMNVPLATYVWSYFNPNNPVGRNDQITKTLKSPLKNVWMRDCQGAWLSDYCPRWMDREEWDNQFLTGIDNVQGNKGDNWLDWLWGQDIDKGDNPRIQCEYGRYGPFLPPVAAASTPETFWMRYKFYFQLGGGTFGFKRVNWPVKEYDTCPPCHPCPRAVSCDTCIDPERDLDRYGLLKKKAFQRIISSNDARKRRALEKLAKLVHKRNSKRKKRVSWADEAHQRPGLRFSL